MRENQTFTRTSIADFQFNFSMNDDLKNMSSMKSM